VRVPVTVVSNKAVRRESDVDGESVVDYGRECVLKCSRCDQEVALTLWPEHAGRKSPTAKESQSACLEQMRANCPRICPPDSINAGEREFNAYEPTIVPDGVTLWVRDVIEERDRFLPVAISLRTPVTVAGPVSTECVIHVVYELLADADIVATQLGKWGYRTVLQSPNPVPLNQFSKERIRGCTKFESKSARPVISAKARRENAAMAELKKRGHS
jgi:hypothetical protein